MRVAISTLLGLMVLGCQAVSPSDSPDAASCPTTKGHPGPPDARPSFFGWSSSYGNGKLWVGGLWPDGVILGDPSFVDASGRVGMKFGWWHTEPGTLRISAERLDAAAPGAIGIVPAGYGATGFQASGVIFPTEGCWAITGTVGSTSLTFVTFVIKVTARASPTPRPA